MGFSHRKDIQRDLIKFQGLYNEHLISIWSIKDIEIHALCILFFYMLVFYSARLTQCGLMSLCCHYVAKPPMFLCGQDGFQLIYWLVHIMIFKGAGEVLEHLQSLGWVSLVWSLMGIGVSCFWVWEINTDQTSLPLWRRASEHVSDHIYVVGFLHEVMVI